jgi:hypothetical protein
MFPGSLFKKKKICYDLALECTVVSLPVSQGALTKEGRFKCWH